MPYNQPATANYFGFNVVAGQDARTGVYLVSSSEANNISIGDVVVMCTSAASISIRRATGSSSTDAGIMVGVAASVVIAGDGSTGADIRVLSSKTCLVYDDPATLFYGCDTTSGVIGNTAPGLGYSYAVCATGAVGSTGPNPTLNRSVMAISAVTASSGSGTGYKFRVIGLHPLETAGYANVASGTASASTLVRKWILKPDVHANSGYGVGFGHVTT